MTYPFPCIRIAASLAFASSSIYLLLSHHVMREGPGPLHRIGTMTTMPSIGQREFDAIRTFVADVLQVRLFMLSVDAHYTDPAKFHRFWVAAGAMLDSCFDRAIDYDCRLPTPQE